MRSVPEYSEMLYEYATGQLPSEEAARLEEALNESEYLRSELVRYEKLLVLITAAAQEDVLAPDSLQKNVDRQVFVRAYIGEITNTVEGILGAYGRAIVYYLGLT